MKEIQQQRNRAAREAWDLYGPHRQRVTQLLASLAPPAKELAARKLAILGAGNANDIDLNHLLQHFSQIHLVDLDAEALAAGVRFQNLEGDPRLQLHGDFDFTGLLAHGEQNNNGSSPDERMIRESIAAARTAPAPSLPDEIDVVASTCLLTQLVECANFISQSPPAGPQTAEQLELLMAVRDRHLRSLCELTRAGGQAVLITDFVSSHTAPELPSVPDDQLAQHAMQWLAARNFFTGSNPLAISAMLSQDARFQTKIESNRVTRPWKWQFVNRVYAVCAIVIQLRSAAEADDLSRR